jgi:DNA-directed RNA polymerase specialized sigma24 family protein
MASSSRRVFTAQEEREAEQLSRSASKIVQTFVRREPWLNLHAGDLQAIAVQDLLAANARRIKQKLDPIENPAGYMTRVMKNRIIDLGRRREVQYRQLRLLAHELPPGVRIQGVNHGAESTEVFPRNAQTRGLSLEIISKEQDQLHSLQATAMISVLPEGEEKSVLEYRFFESDGLSLAQLGKKFGGRSATAMANFLAKIVGTANSSGAVEPAAIVVGQLQMKTAEAFVKVLQNYDDLDLLSSPIQTAIGHLEFASHYSEDHRQQSILGIARLRYLERHMPNARGLSNKVLIRLINAACFYVLEVNDGRHDRQDGRGLQDDVAVLKAVSDVVRRYSPKP